MNITAPLRAHLEAHARNETGSSNIASLLIVPVALLLVFLVPLAGVAGQGGLAGGDAGRRLDGGLCCSDAAAHDGDGDEQSDGRSHDEQPDAGLAALITQPGQGRVAEVHLTTLSTGPVTDRETDGLIHCPV